MFNLIVSVISIALLAALAIASVFYGGEAFTNSSEKANVTTIVNQAQQIAGAAALYRTENGYNPPVGVIDSSHALVGKYLAQVPVGSRVTDDEWELLDPNASGDPQTIQILFSTGLDDTTKTSICNEVIRQKVGQCLSGNDGFIMEI